ncbi:MAG: MATE family efflux transporter [Lachnospiraceae bacterium]|nr:MATE family efflux transporter [Lachnospiraceae bacterium]
MTEEKAIFYEKISGLVVPIAIQNFMVAAVSASDAIMLGVLNQDSLSAVSLAGQIQFVLNLFWYAITTGTTILAAQYWGKGNREAISKILVIALKLSGAISLTFCLAASFTPGLLMRIFTTDPVLIEMGSEYLKIVGISYLLAGLSQGYLCIMKNSGFTLKSTMISSISMILNIVLNAILIFGLLGVKPMGIAGAAIATVISKLVEFVWVVADSYRKNRIKLQGKYLMRTDPVLRKDFTHYMLPVLGNQLAWGCGFTMYTVIMGHLGSDAVAANSIANIVKNLISCFCLGIASGASIMIGNELGKDALKRAREYGDRIWKLAAVSGVVSGLILLACSPVILQHVNLSDTARGYLKVMLMICSYYLVGKSINATIISGIFSAGGDTRFGLICDFVNMWCIVVPMGLLAAFYFKLPVLVVYFVLNLDEIIKIPVEFHHYWKYAWVKDLTRKQEVL